MGIALLVLTRLVVLAFFVGCFVAALTAHDTTDRIVAAILWFGIGLGIRLELLEQAINKSPRRGFWQIK